MLRRKAQKQSLQEREDLDRITAARLARSQFAHLRKLHPTLEPEPEQAPSTPEEGSDRKSQAGESTISETAHLSGPERELAKRKATLARQAAIEKSIVARAEETRRKAAERLAAAEARARELAEERQEHGADKIAALEKRMKRATHTKTKRHAEKARDMKDSAAEAASRAEASADLMRGASDNPCMSGGNGTPKKSSTVGAMSIVWARAVRVRPAQSG